MFIVEGCSVQKERGIICFYHIAYSKRTGSQSHGPSPSKAFLVRASKKFGLVSQLLLRSAIGSGLDHPEDSFHFEIDPIEFLTGSKKNHSRSGKWHSGDPSSGYVSYLEGIPQTLLRSVFQ